jgi:hypothetical protein
MTEYIPEQWSIVAVVIWIFKGDKMNICNNYRGRSLLNLCTKYWQEKFKSLQLTFLLEEQIGFKKGH